MAEDGAQGPSGWSPLPEPPPKQEPEPNILAIDLGLRCGLALVAPDGEVLMYRSKHFPTKASLKKGCYSILKEAGPLRLIVLEGGDAYGALWETAARKLCPQTPLRTVAAEDWRPQMLLDRQQRSGHDAKRAADSLARTLIAGSRVSNPTSLRHDAAEAVCLGVWAARYLLGATPRG